MGLLPATTQQIELANASYLRCQKAPEFFRVFYNRFLAVVQRDRWSWLHLCPFRHRMKPPHHSW